MRIVVRIRKGGRLAITIALVVLCALPAAAVAATSLSASKARAKALAWERGVAKGVQRNSGGDFTWLASRVDKCTRSSATVFACKTHSDFRSSGGRYTCRSTATVKLVHRRTVKVSGAGQPRCSAD